MKAQQALLLVICLGSAGCATSDYTLNLGSSHLIVDPPDRMIPNSVAVVISPDGERIASLQHWTAQSADLVVQEIQSGKVLFSGKETDKEGVLPVMFSQDGGELYCITPKKQLVSLQLGSGEVGPALASSVSEGEYFDHVNAGHTISYGDRGAVTAAGSYTPLKPTGFDMYGNLWGKSGDSVVKLSPDGSLTQGTQPRFLLGNQEKSRGRMTLFKEDHGWSFQDSRANVTAVWLSHSGIKPATKHENKLALVFAGADIVAAGFLPGHQSIYVSSMRGTFFVPYHEEPRNS
jgi:hypothetical protein